MSWTVMIVSAIVGLICYSWGVHDGKKDKNPYKWVCPHDCPFKASSTNFDMLMIVADEHSKIHG